MIDIVLLRDLSPRTRKRAINELELLIAAEPGATSWSDAHYTDVDRPIWELAIIEKMVIERQEQPRMELTTPETDGLPY